MIPRIDEFTPNKLSEVLIKIFGLFKNQIEKKIEIDHSTPYVYDKRLSPKLQVGEDGKKLCNACQVCQKACPTSCLEIIHSKKSQISLKFDSKLCVLCFVCEDVCPYDAIKLEKSDED